MSPKDQTRRDDVAKSAYKAMGALFFACIGINFSTQRNAKYGPWDMFRHLVAMRGKHGYAEGTSNAENIDKNNPKLPSGRWLRNHAQPIPDDKMLTRCNRMIMRSVKRLRRHGLLRKPLDVAIDFHDICRYDKKPNMKYMRFSKHKNGTTKFNTLGTIHSVTEGARACLGVIIRSQGIFPAEAVAALLDKCDSNGIRIRMLMLDREFYSTEIMNMLNERGIAWLMPAVKKSTVKEAISEFESGERNAVSAHSISSGKMRVKFTLIIRPAENENDARETATGSKEGEREPAYHVFATNISPEAVGSDPDQFVERYRKRWGIETAYRCYEEVRSRTTSPHESYRLLLLFFPMLLYNAWVLARYLFMREGRLVALLTLRIFAKYLDVLSCESVLRAAPPDSG